MKKGKERMGKMGFERNLWDRISGLENSIHACTTQPQSQPFPLSLIFVFATSMQKRIRGKRDPLKYR